MNNQTWRIRDPIHGLVVFNGADQIDRLAWQLIQTPEFQRLRRIKQLGISEFVFPGATHTRFSHSIGVYHNARRLMDVIRRNPLGGNFDDKGAKVALIAALLHDLGHGPFSHAFEGACETLAKSRPGKAIETHEKLTAKLILAEDGGVRPLLDEMDPALAEQAAALIRADNPADVYHAVVSSSFDADRLDYLMRDRYMTGTGAGSIDYDWLIDNLATDEIRVPQDDDDRPEQIPTFVFKLKGRQAAEDFLFARYRLYTQVYLHKTTRGFEQIISALIRRVGEMSDDPGILGLDTEHPLVRFLRPNGESLADYRNLDDAVVWGAIERLRRCKDEQARKLALRLWNREPLKVLDISGQFGHDDNTLHNALRRVSDYSQNKLGITIFRDEASYNLYSQAKGDMMQEHKKVRVRAGDGSLKEITEFPDTAIRDALTKKNKMIRYYFLTSEEREATEKAMTGR